MSASVESSEYIVALRYTKAAGGYAGVVTWTPFPSKAEFDKWFEEMGNKDQEVVEEGITDARAIELSQRTPLRSYVRAAVEEATDPRTGIVDRDIANLKMQNVAIMAGRRMFDNIY